MISTPDFRSQDAKAARRAAGTTLVEAMVAMVLAAALLTTLAQFVALAGRQTRRNERQFVATQELANLLERLLAAPWEELTRERLATIGPSAELLRVAPRTRVTVEIEEMSGPPAGLRIRAEAAWPTTAAAPPDWQRVELVGFRFREGASP